MFSYFEDFSKREPRTAISNGNETNLKEEKKSVRDTFIDTGMNMETSKLKGPVMWYQLYSVYMWVLQDGEMLLVGTEESDKRGEIVRTHNFVM